MTETQFDKLVEDLSAAHGIVHVLESDEGHVFIIRQPSRADYRKYRAKVNDDKTKADAQEHFFRDVCVYPTGSDLVQLLDAHPAFGDLLGIEALKIAGATESFSVKKAKSA